jgi:hypothetical protein
MPKNQRSLMIVRDDNIYVAIVVQIAGCKPARRKVFYKSLACTLSEADKLSGRCRVLETLLGARFLRPCGGGLIGRRH